MSILLINSYLAHIHYLQSHKHSLSDLINTNVHISKIYLFPLSIESVEPQRVSLNMARKDVKCYKNKFINFIYYLQLIKH